MYFAVHRHGRCRGSRTDQGCTAGPEKDHQGPGGGLTREMAATCALKPCLQPATISSVVAMPPSALLLQSAVAAVIVKGCSCPWYTKYLCAKYG